jgi:hypothetical protein
MICRSCCQIVYLDAHHDFLQAKLTQRPPARRVVGKTSFASRTEQNHERRFKRSSNV